MASGRPYPPGGGKRGSGSGSGKGAQDRRWGMKSGVNRTNRKPRDSYEATFGEKSPF